jgi:hypothetical protein
VLGIDVKDTEALTGEIVAIDSNAGGEYGGLPTNIDRLIVPVLILRLAIIHLLLV